MSKIALIAAVAEKGAIGRNQQLLCHLPNDLKHFKTLTSGHTVVMGRKTFESLPNGALPNRKNIVLTHNTSLSWPNVTVVHTLDEIPIQDTTEDEIFIMVIAGIVGFFVGASVNEAMTGAVLFSMISGIACIIYTIDNFEK